MWRLCLLVLAMLLLCCCRTHAAAFVPDELRAATVDVANWQGALMPQLGHLTLRQLISPGSHDSAAFDLTSNLAPGISGNPELDDLIALAEKLGIRIQDIITPWSEV